MVMGGMVLETNMNEIVTQIDAQNKLEKSEVRLENALVSEGSEHARELFMPDSVAFTVCPSVATFRHSWGLSVCTFSVRMSQHCQAPKSLCILLTTVGVCPQILF